MTSATAIGFADDNNSPAVEVPASANSPEAVIRFLAGRLVAERKLPPTDLELIIARALRREALGSTAIGGGVAVPHAMSQTIGKVVSIVGQLSTPLDWSAIDGEPVKIVVLAIGPGLDRVDITIVEEIVRKLRNTPMLM